MPFFNLVKIYIYNTIGEFNEMDKLIAIIFIGGSILSIPVNFIYNAFMTLARLIFGI